MRLWSVPAALVLLAACGRPDPAPAAAPLAEAHNFGYLALLHPAGPDTWTVEVRCPSDLDGGYDGGLVGEAIPVQTRRGGMTTGPRASWTFGRARWATGEPFRLQLSGRQSILLDVKIGSRVGDPGEFKLSLLERR